MSTKLTHIWTLEKHKKDIKKMRKDIDEYEKIIIKMYRDAKENFKQYENPPELTQKLYEKRKQKRTSPPT